MRKVDINLLRVASVLWIVWGTFHVFIGMFLLSTDTVSAIQGIANNVEPSALEGDYPSALKALLNQHAWNITWFGLATTIGGVFIWKRNLTAIWVTALIGGLADLGYFIFIDLGGLSTFVPGTVFTIISGLAIACSFKAWLACWKSKRFCKEMRLDE